MAKNQDNDTKILPGLEDCQVEGLREDKDRVIVKVAFEVKEKKYPL